MPKSVLSISVAIFVVLIGLNMAVFTVDERERAILFRFGEVVKADYTPGLHFKTPFMDVVRKYDGRMQTLDADPVRFQTSELKNVVVDSFVKWRISDISAFYVAAGGTNIDVRIAQIVNDLTRREFGKRDVHSVVSGDRKEIMTIVQSQAHLQMADFGIEVVDVRIKRVDLPPDVNVSVYRRMDAERTRVAKDLRARGAEAAERIRAETDKDRAVILAEANRDSEILRGTADATATELYASAYQKNEEFYSFYKSMSAYQNILKADSDVMVVKPDSEFFKYFHKPMGGGK